MTGRTAETKRLLLRLGQVLSLAQDVVEQLQSLYFDGVVDIGVRK